MDESSFPPEGPGSGSTSNEPLAGPAGSPPPVPPTPGQSPGYSGPAGSSSGYTGPPGSSQSGPPPGGPPPERPSGYPSGPPPGPPPAQGPPPPGWSSGMPPNVPPPPLPPRSSAQGTAALVIGIVSIIACCHVLGPVAWYLGWDELRDIRAGRVVGNDLNAKIGMLLGILATGLLVIGLIWAFLFGGMSMLRGMMYGSHRFSHF